MDIQWDRQKATDPVVRPACLVPGCSCKDPRIISSRRVAFFTAWPRSTARPPIAWSSPKR